MKTRIQYAKSPDGRLYQLGAAGVTEVDNQTPAINRSFRPLPTKNHEASANMHSASANMQEAAANMLMHGSANMISALSQLSNGMTA